MDNETVMIYTHKELLSTKISPPPKKKWRKKKNHQSVKEWRRDLLFFKLAESTRSVQKVDTILSIKFSVTVKTVKTIKLVGLHVITWNRGDIN